MENIDLFIEWNRVLFSYFFSNSRDEEDEVSLYITRETIDEIGNENGLGGYEGFLRIVMLPIETRKTLYCELRNRYLGSREAPENLERNYRSTNLFYYATIYTNDFSSTHLDCPYLIYIVFAVLMGSECFRSGRRAIGRYLTEQLRDHFPGHNDDRTGLKLLFDALAKHYPRFRATKLTEHPYIGLIRYQLVLSKTQEDTLNKGMYNADLSELIPYEQWINEIVDYVDQDMKNILRESKTNEVLKRRISDLRDRFDPTIYEQKHNAEETQSKGHFVLAIYEDEFTKSNDRLVLLTNINNKSISDGMLKITKGNIDRIGDYAEYNVNHVLINGTDKAEMRCYCLESEGIRISSKPLRSIVTFSRCGNYLIQTEYPQQGKETYVLVRNDQNEEWNRWRENHGSPVLVASPNRDRLLQIFGKGWDLYISDQIDFENNRQTQARVSAITMGGGINCIGKTNVYLISALPYFEFPEPIDIDRVNINIKIDNTNLRRNEFICKTVDTYKLVIDLVEVVPSDRSLNVIVGIDYNGLSCHEEFDVTGQNINYDDDDLFKINMWGVITSDTDTPYMQGIMVYNSNNQQRLPQQTVLYHPQHRTQDRLQLIDPHDPRFYLINLFTANCCMRNGFMITESRLKKCIRYAVTRLDIDTTSTSSFYTDLRFLLVNSGYMNADYEHGKYQPVPPTFVKTPARLYSNDHLYMLVGSYTQKFLYDLVNYCRDNNVNMYLHESNPNNNPAESLLPPVILLQYNFDPNSFIQNTQSRCQFFGDDDVAVNILNSLPSYQQYGETLQEIRPDVFDRRNLQEPPEDDTFPRIRELMTTGFGTQKLIEKRENRLYRITISDIAWAKLYCSYEKHMALCTKANRDLLFPTDLHLPVMMQRALFISNFGIPQKLKVFICNKADSNKKYFNVVKSYNTKSDNLQRSVLYVLTGNRNDQNNVFIRDAIRCQHYKLEMWLNTNKNSSYPRSLLVLLNGNQEQVIANKNGEEFELYSLNVTNNRFERINCSDINTVLSRYMTTNLTWQQMGYQILRDQYVLLPPREEYTIEEIKII